MTRHQFAGAAPTVHLTSLIDGAAISATATESCSAYPDGLVGPFVICFDRGTPSEEKVLCSGRTGAVFTITTRGYDGTTTTTHAAGATIDHVLDATVVDAHDAHVNDTTLNQHTQYLLKTGGTITGNLTISSGGITITGTTSITGSSSLVGASSTITGTATGTVPFLVNAASGQTADVAQFQINGVTKMNLNAAGSLGLLGGAIATNATDGYFYPRYVNGTPTGVPSTPAGTVAMAYNPSNDKLYVYNGGWKSVTFA